MKISLEIPDWCNGRHLTIIAGTELAAYKNAQDTQWQVKTDRCNRCGKCCRDLAKGQVPLNGNGDCVHLIPDGVLWVCTLGALRPWPCIEGDPVRGQWKESGFCSVKYKAAE